jgi:hypothetical protein
VEPLLTETQQERFQIQKQSEQQRQERSDLLLRVFKDVNRFLGTEVCPMSEGYVVRGSECQESGVKRRESVVGQVGADTDLRRITRHLPTLGSSRMPSSLD